jgi:hypothetical protein
MPRRSLMYAHLVTPPRPARRAVARRTSAARRARTLHHYPHGKKIRRRRRGLLGFFRGLFH